MSELYPKEKDGDDELGDLWLVKYDDGDSEHMNLGEVSSLRVAAGRAHERRAWRCGNGGGRAGRGGCALS